MTLASSFTNARSPYRMPSVRSNVRSNDEAPLGGAEMLTPDSRLLPLVAAKLRVEAGGGLARVVLEQTFENPYDDTLRVTYKMPLPVDGALSGYAFRIGERIITGRVDRKENARARFEAAMVQGKTAALLEQDKADIFTAETGNIPPRQTIVCEITWRGTTSAKRVRANEIARAMRKVGAALDADGMSTTAHAVLARILGR